MLIGIDGNEANVDRKVGISEYVFELLKQFDRSKSKDLRFKIYLKDKPQFNLSKNSENWQYKIFGPKKMWTQFALPARLFLERTRPDVFFSPAHYAPRYSRSPVVISIMDLAFLHFPELFVKKDLYQLTKWTEYSVRNAKKIITISKASKDDIIKLYHIPEEKVYVIYPGIKSHVSLTPHIYPMKELQIKYNINKNFILFIGTLQPRKNIVRAIEAFSKIKDDDLQFVVIGRKGWMYEDILKAPQKYEVLGKVKFLDFVPDEDLPQFYKNAKVFLWPSLYEGFGLPVVEAMSYGCPVITSNVSSLPEAGGEAALYVDPTNTDDIAEKLKTVLESEKLQKEMSEKGLKHSKKFSWDKAAKETLQVLEEVANKI